jgi:hypothetical protein
MSSTSLNTSQPASLTDPALTGEVQLLPIIGESHADPMLGVTVRDEGTGEPVAMSALAHIAVFQASGFLEANGALNQKIVTALSMLRLILYCDDTTHPKAIPHAIMGPNALSPLWGLGWRPAEWPWMAWTPLLFVVGEIDVRNVIKAVPPHADVQVTISPEAFARVPTFVPSAVVTGHSLKAVVAAQLAPMFRGFELMRQAGLGPLAMHSISPCSPDDDEYRRTTTYESHALVRYKIIMLFNAMMREFCEGAGFIFIDRWNDFTEGGLVRDSYMADAVHVKPEYMRESLLLLYQFAQRRKAPS